MAVRRRDVRERIYGYIIGGGVKVVQWLFPDYFGREALAPTDRFVEYPFAVRNLPPPPCRILDVGCAGSFFPLLLAGFGYDTYAIDLREYAILRRLAFERFRFVRGDIRRAPFRDGLFDVVTAISTVEHIGLSGRYGTDEDPAGDRRAVTEMHRLVRGGGLVLLTVPFGRATVHRPYHRVYDLKQLDELTGEFVIEWQEVYRQNKQDEWVLLVTAEEAESAETTPDRYAVACRVLRKRA